MKTSPQILDEVIQNKIYQISDAKVMLDIELAQLFGFKTHALKQDVRRNARRFPEDFMFDMSQEAFEAWRSKNVMSKSDRKGLRYPSFCFTEQDVTIVSCVLNSDEAREMNIKFILV